MCGFAGSLLLRGPRTVPTDEAALRVACMGDALHHRGPDDADVWTDSDAGVAMAFRRLAIVDLSPQGRQPMHSRSGRYVVMFNGEIYNHRDLRQELQARPNGPLFRGESDTETILACLECWGLQKTLEHLVGMFAIAIWDGVHHRLHLIRDRLGEKPLYYGVFNNQLLFASELKAFHRHPAFRPEIDRQSLAMFSRLGYVPREATIYRGVKKLLPGHTVCFSSASASNSIEARRNESYWTLPIAADSSAQQLRTDGEWIDQLESLVDRSISLQMRADVPLGALLSGGVDSSLVVAFMRHHSSQPINTFTIAFTEANYNEAPHARRVADHLGTHHTELCVTPEEAMAVIPRLPTIYDEPFADSSQIPTFLVSQLAREHVTVCLTGDGADELFAGYERYRAIASMDRVLARCPATVRAPLAHLCRTHPWLGNAPRGSLRRKLQVVGQLLDSHGSNECYRRLISLWHPNEALVIGDDSGDVALEIMDAPGIGSIRRRAMLADATQYLPDDVLVKTDRAMMSVSLEGRAPFLDHRIAEFAFSLPEQVLFRRGPKWMLKRILARHVPVALTDRPKQGFGVPLGQWLRGPLREWADELLCPQRLHHEQYFHPQLTRSAWGDHLRGDQDRSAQLWPILVFQAWSQHDHLAQSSPRCAA